MNASNADRMMQMITGYWVTQVVHAAATYSLADHLANGLTSAEAIANAEGTDASATFRLLRACASLGLLTCDNESAFAATPLLDTLRKDNPHNLRGLALSLPAPGHWLPWGRLTDAVKTGKNQSVIAHGAEIFDYFAAQPAEGAAFTEAMTSLTMTVAEETARVIDTNGVDIAADIGGAGGAMLHALLHVNPTLHGIVFDRPHVVKDAVAAAEALGLQERITAIGGDFFESVPEADLYLLKYILHDWDDAACIRLLKNCRGALRSGGRVLLIELVLEENMAQPGLAPMMDINMMVMLSGRERSLAEYSGLLDAAGFKVANVIPTKTPMVIIEAVAA